MFAKAKPKRNCCQTYVVKASAGQRQSKVLLLYAQGELTRGAGAFALREKAGVLHLVITFAEERSFNCRARHIKEEISKIPYSKFEVIVEKFTRPMQRFLGFGDVHATVADVNSAVEKRDVEELLTINPTWKPVIDQDQMELLPKLHAPPEVLTIADKPETDALQTAWQESKK